MNSSKVRLKSVSKLFIKNLTELTAGFLSPAESDKLIELINSEIKLHFFTTSSENNLLRIFSRRYDKGLFFNECIKYPHYTGMLASIASNSNYLTQILEINPEYFYFISDPGRLRANISRFKFQKEISGTLNRYKSPSSKLNALKSIKRKEILRIGLKDFYLKENLELITNQLSVLAGVIAGELFEICFDEVMQKNKISEKTKNYAVVSLGKLGGNELNYSSDIDLIIFFGSDKKFSNGKHYREILTEAIQLFISGMNSSEGGFLYRVDLRLRPDGRNAALCGSLSEYLSYYERRGEDWERQMLIKAGFVCGNKKLFDKFISFLKPFIYPATHLTSPTEEIKRLKESSEKLIGEKENIKIQPGGIRDIEFAVQAMQLLHGGKFKEVQTGNTISAIENLFKCNLINEKEYEVLKPSYIFYRKVEHYLQLMNNTQTHIIPKDDEIENKISHYLGFENETEFRKELSEKRKSVRKFYDSVTGKQDNPKNSTAGIDKIYFSDLKRAASNFQYLREGKGILGKKIFDINTIKLFLSIEKELIKYLEKSNLPDKTLDNFVRVIRFADFPSIWYKEFSDRKFFNYLLRICEYSQRAVDLFAEDKSLRDFFLSRDVFRKISTEVLPDYDFKKLNFQLSVQIVTNYADPLQVSEILSEWVSIKIKSAAEEFVKSYKWKNDFVIAAMGSCGSSEMTFSSDVDLIFVVNNINKYPAAENNFVNLLQKIREQLSPLQTDCRLRPEGKSSQLLWDIESYKNYLSERARIWELQALMKIKFISGNQKLFESIRDTIINLFLKIDADKVKPGMIEMRKKLIPPNALPQTKIFDLRKSFGGIIDIEYITHFILLKEKILTKKYFSKPLNSIIPLIKEIKYKNDLLLLLKNFEFLKRIEILHQAVSGNNSSRISEDDLSFRIFNKLINIRTDSRKLFNEIIKTNSAIFNKNFGRQ